MTRWCFLRILGCTFLAAFVSFWSQAIGLIGVDGIVPADLYVERVQTVLAQNPDLGWRSFPSLFLWLEPSDAWIHTFCGLGTVAALFLILGVESRLSILFLWVTYLSFFTISGPFLGYQWDILLLEVSVLAFFYAPWVRRETLWQGQRPSKLVRWLLLVVLFKLILSSGLVKLNSGDATWQNLTALDYHFWTQPIPHQMAWTVHHLSDWTRQVGVLLNHFVELGVPWLILFSLPPLFLCVWLPVCFALLYASVGIFTVDLCLLIGLFTFVLWLGARVLERSDRTGSAWMNAGRTFAGISIIILMVTVGGSGNYGFFNLLTIALALLCFSDADLKLVMPRRTQRATPWTQKNGRGSWNIAMRLAMAFLLVLNLTQILQVVGQQELSTISKITQKQASQTTVPMSKEHDQSTFWSHFYAFSKRMEALKGRLMLSNGYGLFARMTTQRFELIMEGSSNGTNWEEIQFKYKPNSSGQLRFAGLHMPRLDWQLWFAALYPQCSTRWFFGLLDGLLSGSKSISDLVMHNPFWESPPKFIRVRKSKANFANKEMKRRTHRYWNFEPVNTLYCPVMTLSQLERNRLRRQSK